MMSGSMRALRDRLAALTTVELARLLERRDVMHIPWPADLDQLAGRLTDPTSLSEAFLRLTLPAHEVLEAIAMCRALGESPTLDAVSRQLGASSAAVAPVVDDLAALQLVWSDETGALSVITRFPSLTRSYGRPIEDYLDGAPLEMLRPMSTKLQIRGDGTKSEVVERLRSFFGDRSAVEAILEGAPEAERELLEQAARTDSMLYPHPVYLHSDSLGAWSVQRGFAWRVANGPVSMPLQVTLVLLGDDVHLDFHPARRQIETRPIEAEHVEAEAGRRLLRMVELVSNVLDAARTTPIALIKSGSIGVRTIRTLAKGLYATEDEVQLALELALTENLLDVIEPPPSRGRKKTPVEPSTLVPSALAELWQASEDSRRAGALLQAWWTADYVPLAVHSAIEDNSRDIGSDFLRSSLIDIHVDIDESISEFDDVMAILDWYRPSIRIEFRRDVLQLVLREAELLGVLALGAASSIARGLRSGDPLAAASGVVTQAHTHATIGADLTAVVFGAPGPELAQFFDSVAVRESTGSATTWRFSQSSVRRAFDDGMTHDEVIEGLTRYASGVVPQTVDYLVKDVARTHGSMRVVPLGCVVVSSEEALIAELGSHRRLTKLGPMVLSRSVVGFAAEPAVVLSELRAAGYAPVQDDPGGAVSIARSPTSAQVREYPVTGDPNFALHAEFLTTRRDVPAHGDRDVWGAVGGVADRLIRRRFAAGFMTLIEYDDRTVVVHSARELGEKIEVWNDTEERYQTLEPASIRLLEP
ncbi:helicase-associated domain-containing protein [Rhodococcus sp. P1Y]|uniref:helicase-associated domain-containing protein n=1 Tax=Rhodococcus sp. P1Y TaxID=1302308 RepID=UPI000EAC0CEC|nr:helicase-associated domain-containing protein [Rhodococcus sp. P1Y]AYJ50601.1 hypothetical protein D8W71_22555 [Rhodococcus sp. P1Y]